jgi:hypothetical protein
MVLPAISPDVSRTIVLLAPLYLPLMPKTGNVQQKETPTSCGPDAGELIRAQKKKLQFEG